MFVLNIALRVFTLMEFVVRQALIDTQQSLAGLYDGNPKRKTFRPSAEQILKAFCNLTLYFLLIKEYGKFPMVNCYPGQLNQVIMNLIANAIDALDDSNEGKTFTEIENNPNKIMISTEVLTTVVTTQAIIKIKDNVPGMSDEVKQKVFEHLFTTKGVGKGTGLGLSISRQIVEETHGGKLSCVSEPGNGAEFIIEIPIC